MREGYDPVTGARPLKRAIQKHILDPLARCACSREISAKAIACGGRWLGRATVQQPPADAVVVVET